jgi:hypothetical protein
MIVDDGKVRWLEVASTGVSDSGQHSKWLAIDYQTKAAGACWRPSSLPTELSQSPEFVDLIRKAG